jgi:hypothetical protein
MDRAGAVWLYPLDVEATTDAEACRENGEMREKSDWPTIRILLLTARSKRCHPDWRQEIL